MLPLQLQPSQWFFQPAQDRYHLYSRIELFQCFEQRHLDSGPILVLGDSQARSFFGSIANVAGQEGVNETYLLKLKHFLNATLNTNAKRSTTNGFVIKERIPNPRKGGKDLQIWYTQEWDQGGDTYWNKWAELTGLSPQTSASSFTMQVSRIKERAVSNNL